MKTKVIIVDDHTLFRNGLSLLLNSFDNIEVVDEASNGKEFFDNLCKIDVDVILMDIDMPEMNGIDATKIAIEKYPELKIITLSMYGEGEYYYKMINAGVKGFLLKNSDINEVKKAIQVVADGSTYFSEEILYNIVKNIRSINIIESNPDDLSKREIEILVQICKGLSNKEIGELLNISKRTVDKHRENLLSKTHSKNTANLVMYAIKNKIIK